MRFRPSAMPRLHKCTASKQQPKVLIERTFDAQVQGSCVHDMISHNLEHGNLDFHDIFDKWQPEDPKECYRNFWSAINWIKSLEGIEIIGIEKRLKSNDFVDFDGTADLIFLFDGELYIVDWKTGRVERDYSKQTETYLVLACEELGFKKGNAIEFYTQTSTHYTKQYHEGFMVKFYENLNRIATESAYNPGEHCEFCPIFFECEARQIMLKSYIGILTDFIYNHDEKEKFPEYYEAAKAVEHIIESFKDLFKMEALANKGFKTENYEYAMEEQKRKVLHFDRMLPILSELQIFGTQELKDKLTLSTTHFTEFLKLRTPRDKKKGAYLTEVMEKMDDAGAISYTYFHKLQKRKLK